LIKIIIKEENFRWHFEAFASELFNYSSNKLLRPKNSHRTSRQHFCFAGLLFPYRAFVSLRKKN